MSNTKIGFYSSFAVIILVLFLLITGSPVLTLGLDSNNTIPLGTFITNAGLLALPLTLYWSVKDFRQPTNTVYKYLSILLKTAIGLALLWIPISYLLAGNISFTFSEKESFQGGQLAMQWFWRFSYSVVVIPILVLLMHWTLLLVKRIKKYI